MLLVLSTYDASNFHCNVDIFILNYWLLFLLCAWVHFQVKYLSWCEAAFVSQLGVRSWIHFPEQYTTVMFCSLKGYQGLWRNGKATTDIKKKGREAAVDAVLLNDVRVFWEQRGFNVLQRLIETQLVISRSLSSKSLGKFNLLWCISMPVHRAVIKLE